MEYWNNLTEIDWVLWIAGLFSILEFGKWAWSLIEHYITKFGIETKNMRLKREYNERLKNAEEAIQDIRKVSQNNVEMFLQHEERVVANFIDIKNEVVNQLSDMTTKMNEQQLQIETRLENIDNDGKKRDCSLLRDRLIQGTKYFSQNKDENGVVHISLTDYENLSSMFTEYFRAGGNGAIKHIYETEFQKFKIDNDGFVR